MNEPIPAAMPPFIIRSENEADTIPPPDIPEESPTPIIVDEIV